MAGRIHQNQMDGVLCRKGKIVETGALGKVYKDGEVIIRQGDKGDSIHVIQDGQAEVVKEIHGAFLRLAILGKGDIFGEMAILDHEARMATVRALGAARILTIDKENFLRRIHEDPSLAYRLLQVMSGRVRLLGEQVARFGSSLPDRCTSPAPELYTREKFRAFCKRHLLMILRPTACTSKFLPMYE